MICQECRTRLLITIEGVSEVERHRGATPQAKGDRLVRACGHWETASKANLCGHCKRWLRGQPCSGCQGSPIVMRPCHCDKTYTFDPDGRNVTIKCGYCKMPVTIWDARKVLVGRWGKVEKVIGVTAKGDPVHEAKTVPFVRTVDGCPTCQDTLAQLRRLIVAERGPNGLAFLPL